MPIVSGIGSIVGGIVGGSAANRAGNQVNQAGINAGSAVGTAGNQAAAATNAATATGVAGINNAIGGVQQATAAGQGNVNAATGQANTVAGNLLGGQLQALSPYYAEGNTATGNLQNLANNPFTAPTAAQAAATPGEQFQMQQGLQGVEQQLGASGGAATGGALKALTQYGQGVASTYYQNAFNNALNAYNTNVNTNLSMAGQGLQGASLGQQASENFGNTYNQNTMGSQYFNANLGMQGAGLGLQGSTAAGQLGLSGAETAGNQNLQGTDLAGQFMMQGANARAAGETAQGALLGNGIAGLANGIGGAMMPGGMFGLGTSGGYVNPLAIFSGNNPYFGPSASSQPGWTGAAAPPPGGYGSMPQTNDAGVMMGGYH
jgi:hypothetical protein